MGASIFALAVTTPLLVLVPLLGLQSHLHVGGVNLFPIVVAVLSGAAGGLLLAATQASQQPNPLRRRWLRARSLAGAVLAPAGMLWAYRDAPWSVVGAAMLIALLWVGSACWAGSE